MAPHTRPTSTDTESESPMTPQTDPRTAADRTHPGQNSELWDRYRLLVATYQEHDGISLAIPPEDQDEALLTMLSCQPHAYETPEYLAIEGWLAMAYTAKVGYYSDPQARAQSTLAGLVQDRAYERYYCPYRCAGTEPGCDHCQHCEGGQHRLQALAAHQLGTFLTQAQFDAHRELADQ
ncbi:hypothetical protein [Streptacidiphilus sp. MAP5-52]|uniref:hypothetical protein n=1 Tax=Streptacidiphilus sp. MAP5-52 TaxID=3156267 RepID=UPI00351497EC